MQIKSLLICLAIAGAAYPEMTFAAPVSVSYAVTGSPDAWTLNFSVSNNVTGFPGLGIYFFMIQPNDTINGSPPGWPEATFDEPFSNASSGGSSTIYNKSWISIGPTGSLVPTDIYPGQTLSGFDVLDTSLAAPTSVDWSVYAFSGSAFVSYTGGGNFNGVTSNPGFEGVATNTLSSVPEPASLALLGAGLAGLGFVRRRKRA